MHYNQTVKMPQGGLVYLVRTGNMLVFFIKFLQ